MIFKPLLLFFISLFYVSGFSQTNLNTNQQKMAGAIVNYFSLDRENIHLHFNKNIYLSNESIWFKGYIVEKKYKPSFSTSNVYVTMFGSNGKKITSSLIYAENGIFEGHIKLDKKFGSGKYFLQVYTHFMNNFVENESSVYEITILNTSEKSYTIPENTTNYEAISCNFFPEGGTFLEGVSNTIGVRISDCNNHGLAINDGQIMDSKGFVISNFSTNTFGFGKFELATNNSERYKAVYEIEGKRFEKALPVPVSNGISFSIINYMYPNKTIIKLKTNPTTLNQIKNKPFNLVFQQNETSTFAEFTFTTATELVLTIPNTELADGINTVWLIDQNQKPLGERILYKPSADANKTVLNMVSKNSESIEITGSSPIQSGSLSISVLPSKATHEFPKKTIQDDLQFSNYLSVPFENSAYYLTDFSRKKHFELDNYLLSQHSKYNWNAITGSAPQKKYESDFGLNIKGTVNSDMEDPTGTRINLSSLGLGLNLYAPLSSQKEFVFENILARDSMKIYFNAIGKNEKKLNLKIYSQLLNQNRAFLKPFEVAENNNCPEKTISNETIAFPMIDNAISLDSINIVNKKNKLLYQNRRGNYAARAFKITDQEAASYRDVLHFIESNSYNVSLKQGITFIESYIPNPRIAQLSPEDQLNPQINGPAIYIDGLYVQSYDMLRDLSMTAIDEIYINKTAYDVSIRGSKGIIQIYTRKNSGTIINNNAYNKSQFLLVKNGFQRPLGFENPKYNNVMDEGFLKLGTIAWLPLVKTDERGTFHFTIPNLYQKTVICVIEGLANDGQMISETVILNTN